MNIVAFRADTPAQSRRLGEEDLGGLRQDSIREAVKGLCTARLIELYRDLGSAKTAFGGPLAADVLRRARCIADADRILETLKAS